MQNSVSEGEPNFWKLYQIFVCFVVPLKTVDLTVVLESRQYMPQNNVLLLCSVAFIVDFEQVFDPREIPPKQIKIMALKKVYFTFK